MSILQAEKNPDGGILIGRGANIRMGSATVDSGVAMHGEPVVAQASHIVDASVAHALNAVFSDVEVETALDALGAKINSILVTIENVGITAKA